MLLAVGAASAQGYPSRPVRLVIGFPPGGPADLFGRVLAQGLSANLGQPVIVENRSGAGGVVGVDTVAKSAPDGYTLAMNSFSSVAMAPFSMSNMPYDPRRDLALITTVVRVPEVVVTNPSLPALIELLFPSAKAPTNFPRTDLVTVFLKGIEGLNQPKNVVASEMMRLNTSIAPRPAATQLPLGVAATDNAGFPNGRRPGDDVVDVSIRVAMGALCALTGATDTLKVGCKPSDAPAGGLALTDGVRRSAADYLSVFPYLTTPLPGNFSVPDNLIDSTK